LIGSPVSVSPTVTTTYTVTGENAFGCTNTTTLTLTVSDPTITATASSATICAGTSATLTGSGVSTYTWNPGALTGSTISVTPSVTTTYTVDGNNVFGCLTSQTVIVNVNTAPSLSISSTPTVLCAPGSLTLTGSGAITYTWSPIGVTTATAVDNPSVTTTYTLTGSDAIGCSSTGTITIAVGSPTIILTSSSLGICTGASATLTASGAASYTWNPGSLTGSTVSVNPLSTTVYTVTGLVGTCTSIQTITLNVSATPTIIATASSNTICAGTSATLTGTGASTYTWNPGGLTGSTVVVTPSVATTYTVDGDNGFGCLSSQTITININAAPSLSISSTPTVLCAPGSLTLTGSGAVTYTWSPIGVTTATAVDNPSVTTTYTLTGSDAIGCSSTGTITIAVGSPTIILTSSSLGICIGASATLTASGAASYTWNPVSLTGSTISVSPTVTTTYTVTGIVGTCIGTQTINLNVSPSPTLVVTASSATICEGTTTTLTVAGASTYTWNPGGLIGSTVAVTPSVTTTYTVDGDNGFGCIASETIIITVNAAPSLSVSATPTVLCVAGSVTLTGSGAATYTWSPLGVTTSTAVDSPSITTTYTLTGTDLIGCSSNQTITISVGNPTITIVSTPSVLCLGSTATLTASGASSYTWSPLAIVGSTVTDSPLINTTYTVTGANGFGCVSTNTFVLAVIDCSLSTSVFGLTKAVSTPTIINSNAYNVTYTLVATNASAVNLTNFSIIDNLTTTFPLPTTYSVISAPLVTSINSSLTVNSLFDGALQNDLLSPLTSTLLAGKADTIVFTVQINPNGFMGPFYNSGVGFGTDSLGIVVSDSSNTGFYYDPDLDGDPTNNDTATVLTLPLFSQIGVAKSGSVSTVLDDKTLDVTYVIKVKNLGNDTLKMVQLVDILTIPLPATYTIKSGPIATGSLTANPLYDGILDPNLLVASSSTLAPGQTETITFVLNITPNEVKSIINIGVGSGVSSLGGIVQDSSNAGGVVDPNGNDIAGEQGENIPTVLELPEVNIFVPDVFTPNGDGKNDLFVIKGITGRVVKLTVFNRWGNLVYEVDAYDNTWNGTPNVSALIIGNSKLPQGTYFFIAEFEDGKTKTINGYVVLQY
jgi:gliding motility-associated-like protein